MSVVLIHLLKRHLLYTQTHHKFGWTTSYNRNNDVIKSGVASLAGIHTHAHAQLIGVFVVVVFLTPSVPRGFIVPPAVWWSW